MSHPATTMWSFWIANEHLSSSHIDSNATMLRSSSAPAIQVMDFWRREQFSALGEVVRSLPYERLLMLRDDQDVVRSVDEATFNASRPQDRFCCHDRAVELDRVLNEPVLLGPTAYRILRHFFVFSVSTPGLSSWLSELLRCRPLKAHSLEIARYRPGDFIAEHTDHLGDRVCNIVTYLDDTHEDHGGTLSVVGPSGGARRYHPHYNSLVVLPIAQHNRHSVEAWRTELGRHSISISFRETA